MAHNGIRSAMLATAVVSVVAITGCGNFENSLDWEESALADQLTGSWRLVEGDDKASVAEVSRSDDGAFRIQLEEANGKTKAVVVADLLAAESVHVLQVRMETYTGKDSNVTREGFRFRRATLADNVLTLQQADVGMLGKLAEEAYADAGVQMKAGTVAGCLGDDMTRSLPGLLWHEMIKGFDDDLRAKVLAALGNKPPTELEEELAKLADLVVDPYKELSQMRNCIARHLSGEQLGDLFRLHADLAFAGEVDRYVRR